MNDETPAAPRRSRRRAPSAAVPDELVGVMADSTAEGTEPEAGSATPGQPASTAEPANDAPAPAELGEAIIRIERGGIGEATAGSVDVRMGGIGALDAEEVFVQWGGVGAARADRLGVEFGSVGAALAGEVKVTQGFVGGMVAREATLEQSVVRTLIAQNVTATRPTGVLVMIAQNVSGDIRPLLDWRGALAAGAAFGLVAGLLRTVRGRG